MNTNSKSIPLTVTDFDKECDLFLEWLYFSTTHKYLRARNDLNRKIDRLIRQNKGDYSWYPGRDTNWLEADELYQSHINQVYSFNYWKSYKQMVRSWAERPPKGLLNVSGKAIFVSTVDEVNGGMFSELQKMWNDPKSYGTEPSTEEQHKNGLFRYFRPGFGEYLSESQGPVTVNIDKRSYDSISFTAVEPSPYRETNPYDYKRELELMRRIRPYTLEESIAMYPMFFKPYQWTNKWTKPIPFKTKLQMAAFAVLYTPIIAYIVYALTKSY